MTTAGSGKYTVEGGRQLRKSLKDVEAGLADLKAAHRAAADVVVPAARSGAPRSSGALAASVRPGATKSSAIIRAGGGRIPYAEVQEWGWPGRHIPAQPYVKPAAQETEPEWTEKYLEAVNKLLAKVRGAPGL